MPLESYSVDRIDHLGIVAGTIKDLGLIEFIDSRLGQHEDETLSVGETVAGIIMNGLGFSNKPGRTGDSGSGRANRMFY